VRAVSDLDPGARDLLGALDRVKEGDGETPAVRDGGGVGVEQADEGVDVLGFPRPQEVPDQAPACLPAELLAGAWAARTRWRADEASWRQAAGVRPVMSATSANG
jgi:hypothetical protein